MALLSQYGLMSGCNADMLDGKHAAAFALSKHSHAASDITSGNLPIERGGTGAGTAADACRALGAMRNTGGTFTGTVYFANGTAHYVVDCERGHSYVEQLDPLWKASLVDDDHWHYDVFSCKSGEKQVGSISSDYAQTGSFDLNDKATWSWHYIRKMGKLGAEAMMYEKFNGSGSTYVRAAFFSPGSAGVSAPWRGGSLYAGAYCGLPCAFGHGGPGTASWSGVPRLAGSGKKRG